MVYNQYYGCGDMAEYKVNDIVTGVVTGIEKYGIFVGLENGYSGLIHISEVSNFYVKDINNFATIGKNITSKVLKIDRKNKKLILSLKETDNSFKESGTGFNPLKEKLPEWIKEKA